MPKEQDIPARIEDFLVLPVAVPRAPSFPQPASHYFYVRAHKPKRSDEATPRSLFLANVPIDANDILIKHLLGEQLELPAGRIQEVQFLDVRGRPEDRQSASDARNESSVARTLGGPAHANGSTNRKRKRDLDLQEQAEAPIDIDLPSTWDRNVHAAGTNAVVVFVDRASRDAVLKAVKSVVPDGKKITWGEGLRKEMPPLGLQRYLKHHELTYPPQETLIRAVNEYMSAYTDREAAQARLAARKRQEPDEDGFVTVTRGGRMAAAKPEQAAHRLEKEKERQKGYNDFYRFQFREKRKEKAGELIRKFEEDRARVKKMKEQRRKFQPE